MDFSDFSEFIGPIIFGLIAWLSNYFSKKKKPSKDGMQDKENQNGNNKTFQSIFDDFNKICDTCFNDNVYETFIEYIYHILLNFIVIWH